MCEIDPKGWDVRSDGKFFRVSFHSNDRFESTGFRASYIFQADPPSTTEMSAYPVSEKVSGSQNHCKFILYSIFIECFSIFCR